MEKEDVLLLAQLFHAMQDAVKAMERAHADKNAEKLAHAKRTILELQHKIDRILNHDS